MKAFYFLIFLTTGLISSAQDNGIKFCSDSLLSDALKRSKTEKKLVFVDCFTSWCVPCRSMDSIVYPNGDVGKFFNSNFICIKLDMESPEGRKIRSKYNVNGYPTFLFLNSDGDQVYYRVGFNESKAFINVGKRALDENLKRLAPSNFNGK